MRRTRRRVPVNPLPEPVGETFGRLTDY